MILKLTPSLFFLSDQLVALFPLDFCLFSYVDYYMQRLANWMFSVEYVWPIGAGIYNQMSQSEYIANIRDLCKARETAASKQSLCLHLAENMAFGFLSQSASVLTKRVSTKAKQLQNLSRHLFKNY